MTGEAAWVHHLRVAVIRHIATMQRDCVPVPPELIDLTEALNGATERQAVTTFDTSAAGLEDAPVDAIKYDEAARRLSVSERTVLRLAASGDLPAVSIGGCRRIRTVDLAAYVERLGHQ